MRKHYLVVLFLFIVMAGHAQQGNLSGDLMMNVNFFQRDTNIKASGNQLYDNFLSGGEGWLGLRYSVKGFTATVRFDAFQNSNLQTPTSALTAAGIGMYSLSKEFQNLTITAGHVYDQIGSGIIFRAYEDRGLLIDNALFGLHLKYRANKYLTVKGFSGQTKNLFDRYKPILKGFAAEGDLDLGKSAHITPGIGIVNRTMDQASMDQVISTINSYPMSDRFTPVYNSFASTFYNTLNAGDFTWYVEAAYKSHEAVSTDIGLKRLNGNVLYSTLGYSQAKFGINANFKRTENFMMRTSPNETLIKGLYNWQPIIAQIRPQRLIARYTPPSQDLSEMGGGINAFVTPNENVSFNISYTHINTLAGDTLYREAFVDAEIRSVKDFIFHIGAQYLVYNQSLYQQKVKSNYPNIIALTPFVEVVYKINDSRSIRTELQYMNTKQDFGSWFFGLLEFSIASKWSFAVSDMYNIAPNYKHVNKAQHYPNFFIAHTRGAHRFTAQYVKQVEGINCTGGVCRYEPAFSGARIGVISTF
ncbi:MAG: hypothetical protein IPL09_08635 [Bacteroidetes bacterium]|nr:hypothetical protein [Bacteroidota bacterium]HQW46828.1 DUF6029 family protein [Chitinophagaceae bacterium]MBK7038898.1 hypothetical protein [Bacteroidota bacterium]MBK7589025.1 hypothetical protein [Bacteroidota bacterium]MBK8329525.1 hypothetical protein [Bacteroidota bacterium]